MPAIIINGTAYALPPIQPNSGSGGGFAFALAKGGSVLLNNLIQRLAHRGPISYVSLPNMFGARGIDLLSAEISEDDQRVLHEYLRTPGAIFGGWRGIPLNFRLPLDPPVRAIFLVRDPRDIAISLYFHLLQGAREDGAFGARVVESRKQLQQETPDDFVIGYAENMRKRFGRYEALNGTCDLLVIRYEDVIFHKAHLADLVCSHFRLDIPLERRRRIAAAFDKLPEVEDPGAHIRQVCPGDHRRKLKPETIARLDDEFAEVLERYGYSDARVSNPVDA